VLRGRLRYPHRVARTHPSGGSAPSEEARRAAKVGVSVFVVREDGKCLLGRRLGAHGPGTWSLPGGKPDPGEDLVAGGLRELLEETGLQVANPRLVAETYDEFEDAPAYVTHYVRADYLGGEPQLLEPAKCGGWEWFSWDALPAPLFLPLENLLRQGFELADLA